MKKCQTGGGGPRGVWQKTTFFPVFFSSQPSLRLHTAVFTSGLLTSWTTRELGMGKLNFFVISLRVGKTLHTRKVSEGMSKKTTMIELRRYSCPGYTLHVLHKSPVHVQLCLFENIVQCMLDLLSDKNFAWHV